MLYFLTTFLYSRLHTNRLIATITTIMTPTIKNSSTVFPKLYAALSRRDPIPSTEYVLFPYMRNSATIREFHPPPQPVMLPVINEGYNDGNKTRLMYWRLLALSALADSSISPDIDRTPPIRLNRMYHCIPVSISRIEGNSSPPGIYATRIAIKGKNAVAGIAAKV